MQKFALSTLFLCIFLFEASGQQKSTLINYYASFGDAILNQLDTYAPTTSREKENFSAAKSHLNEHFNRRAYERLESALSEKKSITFEPIATLQEYDIVYNDLGYPIPLVVKGAINKARKRGHVGEQYYAVSIYCSDVASIASASKLAKQSKPQIKVNINVFDADGAKINKVEAKMKGRKPIKAKEFSPKFDKMEEGSMDDLLAKVDELVDQAIDEAVQKL